jgi:anti-sigma regulatory factor (Ser/Thr protein kinase)
MSGSPHPPAERTTTDLCPGAFPAAPTFTPRKVRDTGHPTHGQQPQRQAPAELPLLTSHLELGPLLTAAASARGHVRAVLTEWGLDELSDVTELLASELVTNAVHASQALDALLPFPVRLWVHATRKRVLVTVWDADPRPPKLQQDVDVWAENGRGLQILDVLSSRWGWYEPPVMGGKCVWCEIPRQPAY